MFDALAPCASLSDAGLIEAMGEAARAESAAIARRLAAVGELYARRSVEWADRNLWCTDPFEAVAAEVSAAQNISRGRAGTQISHARDLRERLPRVAAVFASGAIDYRVVATIMNRTSIVSPEAISDVDAVLARLSPRWTKLSAPKLADRIDLCIAKCDPDGVRVPSDVEQDRHVEVKPTTPGMAGIWANIHATDAAAFDQRLDALAATVCKDDPRTSMQRRSDAVGALAAGADRLPCACGSTECPAGGGGSAVPVVIHLLAEHTTVTGGDVAGGECPGRPVGSPLLPGYLPGFGIQPAEAVRALIASARLKPLTIPGGDDQAGYRPSAGLAEFIRWRDLTCRWPGCDAPASVCDIDHTVPWPLGPTRAANNKLYCRAHHLVKTFYSGPGAWSESQSPDGTVTFTSPTGHVYSTQPLGALIYPALAVPTGVPVVVPVAEGSAPNRGMAMPTRKRSRDEDRRARAEDERRKRAALNEQAHRETLAAQAEEGEPPF